MNLQAAEVRIREVILGSNVTNGVFDFFALMKDSPNYAFCLPAMPEGNCYKSRTCKLKSVIVDGEMLPFVLKFCPEFCPDPRQISIDFPTQEPTQPPSSAGVPFYRFYNDNLGHHLYTTNWEEIWSSTDIWSHEGIECNIYPNQEPGTVPLYRYFLQDRDYFYTTNEAEIGTTEIGQVGKYGYVSQGVAGYCYPNSRTGVEPLYRFVEFGDTNHFYTTSYAEGQGWLYESVACYVPK
jgi:hypothetical protein